MKNKVQTKKSKKISQLSAIIMIIGASIGAGIFIKNKELSQMAQGNLILVICTWIIAGFAIMCLALSLIKVSAIKESNRGILGWTSVYTNKLFHKAVANYKKFFYIPIMVFSLAIYVTQLLVQAGLPINNDFVFFGVAFLIFAWIMLINLISLRNAEVFQWFITSLKIIPLLIIPIIAFVNFGNVGQGNTIWDKHLQPPHGLAGASTIMVIILGLPSVLFSFVGFHSLATQRDNLKQPQKLGKALLWGISIILMTYLFLTFAFNVGSKDGSYETIKMAPWLMKTFQIFIAAGILSIMNGILMSAMTQWKNMMLLGQSNDLTLLHKFLFKKKPEESSLGKQNFTVITFFFIVTTLLYVVFGLIGIFLLSDTKQSTGSGLTNIADILSNYMSLFILLIIATIILGALIKHKKLRNFTSDLHFKIVAIFAIALFYSALIFSLIGAIVDATGFNGANFSLSLMKAIALFTILALTTLLGFLDIRRENRRTKNHRQNLQKNLPEEPHLSWPISSLYD